MRPLFRDTASLRTCERDVPSYPNFNTDISEISTALKVKLTSTLLARSPVSNPSLTERCGKCSLKQLSYLASWEENKLTFSATTRASGDNLGFFTFILGRQLTSVVCPCSVVSEVWMYCTYSAPPCGALFLFVGLWNPIFNYLQN